MRKSKIALIGFRATGKSVVGRLLAEKLSWCFVDMDDHLVAGMGMSIDAWVRLHGWPSFRREETRVLRELARRDRVVLATGGGVVLAPENRELLHAEFQVIWLKVPKETIISRIRGDERSAAYRPPLTELDLEREVEFILRERLPLYEAAANLTIEVDQLEPRDVVLTLLGALHPVDDSAMQA